MTSFYEEPAKQKHTVVLDPVQTFVLSRAPKPVGQLDLVEGFSVAAYKKPTQFHRWAMRVVFGWKWKDHAPKPEKEP